MRMHAYRLLLRLYPRSFRLEYGDEMCAIFERRRRAAQGAGVLALWAHAMADTLVNAARVQWDVLVQDLRHAARTLSRTPSFALAAILVAALGIGTTTVCSLTFARCRA